MAVKWLLAANQYICMPLFVYIESNDILFSSLHSFFFTVLRKTNLSGNMRSKEDDNDGANTKKAHAYIHT